MPKMAKTVPLMAASTSSGSPRVPRTWPVMTGRWMSTACAFLILLLIELLCYLFLVMPVLPAKAPLGSQSLCAP